MSPYSELLRDPRWQKKRLEILDRDKFTCRRCNATDKTLHVHHTYYLPEPRGIPDRTPPWDYPSHTMVTLCEDCHSNEEECKGAWDKWLAMKVRMLGATNNDIERLTLLIDGVASAVGAGGSLMTIEMALDDLCAELRLRNH